MNADMNGIDRLTVDLDQRSYEIHVGDGAIVHAGAILKPLLRAPRCVVVTDETVEPLWLGPLLDSLESADIEASAITLPPGEHTKSFAHLQRLIDDLLSQGIDRKTTLIALGGGVIGDLTGFAAAIALRGIDFVQVPTTLLAQVDSSVGGKTGIDTRHGKNLVGAFHQPRAVIADTAALDTLPRRELLAGYAEIVKYGVINDISFFEWLEANGQALLDGDPVARRHAVLTSCATKAEIVAADEREAGLRALLNMGHTFAHALEAQLGFDDRLRHGEAVAIGMVLALDLSSHLAVADESARDRLIDHLSAVGLPVDLGGLVGDNWTATGLAEHMSHDKKAEGGSLTFILSRGVGNSFIARDVDRNTVVSVLDAYLKAAR